MTEPTPIAPDTDLLVVGAGPAGLAAAATAADLGLDVHVLDEQSTGGGQIYRGLGAAQSPLLEALGEDYAAGRPLLQALSHPRVTHLPGASVWQLESDLTTYYTAASAAAVLRPRAVILATGAMERPMPFPGWTLPGVMGAGAAQVVLKTAAAAPVPPVLLAGSGPLLFLLAWQYLRAGVEVAGLVETTPAGHLGRALRHLPGALRGAGYLKKGAGMLAALRRGGVPHHRRATDLRALGTERVEALSFLSGGARVELPCQTLLVHQGVVPNVQITRSLSLEHDWDPLQRCWRPRLGPDGDCAIPGLYVAGDGGGIGGARAAEHQGRLAALHAAGTLDALPVPERDRRAAPERDALARHLAVRPFLDALYAPLPEFLSPSDETIVCRCEEVTAASVRGYVALGCLGPNQAKAFGRPGMGPCQGRFCGLTVAEVIAAARGEDPATVGYYRIRPPIKPLTLGELAAMPLPAEERDDGAS